MMKYFCPYFFVHESRFESHFVSLVAKYYYHSYGFSIIGRVLLGWVGGGSIRLMNFVFGEGFIHPWQPLVISGYYILEDVGPKDRGCP
jgi:hypothetical protein